MARRQLTHLERQAMWGAYEHKCAYTQEFVPFEDMHVDHILPLQLENAPEQLRALLYQLDLPPAFNLNGLENLLPCKPGVNTRKNDRVLNHSSAHHFLGIADSKKATIEKNIVNLRRQLQQGKVVSMILSAIEQGEISREEAAELLRSTSLTDKDPFSLLRGLRFSDEPEILEISKGSISSLRSKPVWSGGPQDRSEGLHLNHEDGRTMSVHTCEEYDQARSQGFFPLTTYAMKMATYFEQHCGLLAVFENAQRPIRSYIETPKVGIIDLNLIPLSLFPNMGESPWTDEELRGLTYQDKVNSNELAVQRVRQNELLIVQPDGLGHHLIEAARADFDGDGIEDILVFSYEFSVQGTFGYGGITLLTRKEPGVRFEFAPLPR